MPTAYRGRFAPSPTGPLHFGSLVAAVGSFLDARRHGGEWLVRIEDLDPPREVAGAAAEILRTLERFALYWDGPVVYQSARAEVYAQAAARLLSSGVAYPCGCTRRDVFDAAGRGGIYPGTCRSGLGPGRRARALRVRVGTTRVTFEDRVQGYFSQDLGTDVGDFVVRRADGYHAYQLAVVVDDAAQAVTDVVRGADLIDSTPRQIFLQQVLGLPVPRHAHLPLALDATGQKLGKATLARPSGAQPAPELARVLEFLGHAPPPELALAPPAEQLAWACSRWRLEDVPRANARHVSADGQVGT